MIEDGVHVNDNITSFLIESLVWNVPNYVINSFDTWQDTLSHSIAYIYSKTKDEQECKKWGEVSDLLYLFHGSRKWTVKEVNSYMLSLFGYLEDEGEV